VELSSGSEGNHAPLSPQTQLGPESRPSNLWPTGGDSLLSRARRVGVIPKKLVQLHNGTKTLLRILDPIKIISGLMIWGAAGDGELQTFPQRPAPIFTLTLSSERCRERSRQQRASRLRAKASEVPAAARDPVQGTLGRWEGAQPVPRLPAACRAPAPHQHRLLTWGKRDAFPNRTSEKQILTLGTWFWALLSSTRQGTGEKSHPAEQEKTAERHRALPRASQHPHAC